MNENRSDNLSGREDQRADVGPAQSAYSDASYTQAPAGGPQSAYGYNPSYSYTPPAPPEPAKPKKPRKRVSVGAVIAICLVCVLLAGAAGVGGAYLLLRARDDAPADSAAVQTAEPALTEPADADTQQTQTKTGSVAASYSVPPLSLQSTSDASVMSAEQIYNLACQQVVGVSTELTGYNVFGQTVAESVSGSGIIISDDGFILTNYHVVEEAYRGGYDVSVLTYDGTEYAAEIVGVEPDSDVAVLKIDAVNLSYAALGDSNDMAVGQIIYAIGNPLGELSYTMTSGIVSALDRSITTDTDVTVNMFQIDAAVNSGNSGGPVYNQYGQVIGIVTAKYSSTGVEGIGFAIPISDATYIASELLTNGYVSGKAYMGVTITTVSSSVAQYYNMVEGAFVNSVTADSAADKAGLEPGDVITGIDDKEVLSSSDLTTAVKGFRAGEKTELTVFRDGEYLKLSITFDEELPETETETETTVQEQTPQVPQDQPAQGSFPFNDMEEFFNYFNSYGNSGSYGG